MIGQEFDRAGQADSARKYFTEYVEMAGNGRLQADPYNIPRTLFRLGQLYQDAGDRAKALDYYGRFVDLWKNADPELQPRVAEARRAIAELVPDRGM
jgi:eukaryotic-like serine/threonine-protein kinase